MRNGAMRKGSKLYPAYKHVQEEKKKKYIPNSPTRGELGGIKAKDYNASFDLEEFLNHTAKRIIESVGLEIKAEDLIMTSKLGYDGCSGQSAYKQMVSEDVELASIAVEESFFLTCLVPFQIRSKETDEVVWTNPKSSPTLNCRPIRFQYKKESKDVLVEENNFFKEFQTVPTRLDS